MRPLLESITPISAEMDNAVEKFLHHLYHLESKDIRTLRKTIHNLKSPDGRAVIYRLSAPILRPYRIQYILLLVSVLWTIYPCNATSRHFGFALRQLTQSYSIQMQIQRWLNMPLFVHDPIFFQLLHRFIRLCHKQRIPLNLFQLVRDLLRWNYPSQLIQSKYAHTIAGLPSEIDT